MVDDGVSAACDAGGVGLVVHGRAVSVAVPSSCAGLGRFVAGVVGPRSLAGAVAAAREAR